MNGGNSNSPAFAAVILAAGRSSRMGRPKLLLPWGPTSVIGHLLFQWHQLQIRQLTVVCAPGDEALDRELDRLAFPAANRIPNPAPERGMFSSLQCAAAWSGWEPGLTHWVIALGDQPQLRQETLAKLLQFSQVHPEQISQPAIAGRPRHPVVLPRPVFLELATSTGPTLKDFLLGRASTLIELEDPGLDLDLDRPEDYERALRFDRESD